MEEFKELKRIIESYYLVNMLTRKREKKYIYSRAIFCKIAFERISPSKSKIGKFLQMTHASVINSLNNFDGIIITYPEVKKIYKSVLIDYKKAEKHFNNFKRRAALNQLEYHQEMVCFLKKELNLQIN